MTAAVEEVSDRVSKLVSEESDAAMEDGGRGRCAVLSLANISDMISTELWLVKVVDD